MPRTGHATSVIFAFSFSLAALLVSSIDGGSTTSGVAAAADKPVANTSPVELLNVACDPTRELWQDINEQFAKVYERDTGRKVTVQQSHGGSSSQARAVNDGLEADVVTLAMWPDTDSIRRSGLIGEGWEKRLPENSLPYYSTIVFVVRKGNPKQIHDWQDLIKPDVQIITPHPKTSGNGKLSFLAAWGSVVTRGGSEEQAKEFVTKLYQQVPVLDVAARAATMTFSKKNIGDVHLTWENEGQQEVQDSHGDLEIVYPPVSFKAEPHVAWVDENVKKHGTADAAQAYLEFLYTPVAQQVIAKHFYRPNSEGDRQKFADRFPPIKLFGITAVAKDWDDAYQKFFNDGALFDQVSEKK